MIKKIREYFPLPIIPVILVPFILTAPLYLTGKAVFWGTPSLQFIPWWKQAWETILQGELPLWNPNLGMGTPLLANYQSALCYPFTWVYIILFLMGGTSWMAWGQALMISFHLAIAGVGMAVFTRKLGWSDLTQTLTGLAFGMSQYLVLRSQFLSINAAAAWIPWIFMGFFALSKETKFNKKWFLLLTVFLALQLLSGHAQTTWYTIQLGLVMAIFWSWLAGKWAGIWKGLTRIFLSGLLAVGIASIQLIPTAELLLQSQRSNAVDFEYAMNFSLWPWRFLTLVFPNLFGNPAWGAGYWGNGSIWEDATYIGLISLIFAIVAIVKKKTSTETKKFTALLVSIIVVSFIFALGSNTPVFPWLYLHIPTFSMFQAPARYLIWAEVALVLLAGLGLENWQRPTGKCLYWSRLAVAGALALSIGALAALLGSQHVVKGSVEIQPSFIISAVITSFLGILITVLNLTSPPEGKNPQKIWEWSVILVLAVDLLIANWGSLPGIEISFYQDRHNTEIGDILDGKRLFIQESEEQKLKYGRFITFNSYQIDEPWQTMREIELPDISLLDGIASANNFDPLLSGRYYNWIQQLNGIDLQKNENILRVMNVGLLETIDPTQPLGVQLIPVTGSTPARLVTCSLGVDTPESALDAMFDTRSLEDTIILEGGPSSNQNCTSGAVNVTHRSSNRIELAVMSTEGGWLVLYDTWYPGWKAIMDGTPVEILHADYLFKGIPIPSGYHEVTFIYRPGSFYSGLIISLISTLGIGYLTWKWNHEK
ncbi:MAG: YfhO family protein [Anaerolineales bacterium]|nr:YfhO family protein [Anaerolineales bacterium]